MRKNIERLYQILLLLYCKTGRQLWKQRHYLVSNIGDAESISVAYSYSHSFSRNGDLVVEEYMIGPEVSVETLTVNGECNVIQITDKITTGAPHFVEMGHTQPSQLPENTKQKVAQLAKLANRAIGIINGPSHTEIIVTNEGPKIVELGARLGGDCITMHLVPLSTGVDMVECCIKIALGETPGIFPLRLIKFLRSDILRKIVELLRKLMESRR